MKLRDRVPKVHGSGVHRECPADQTYERVRPHFDRIGITEVVDVTSRRLGIPVFNAVVPASVDEVPVYGGKGATRAEARTSAVMEAVERFSAWLPLRPARIASYAELAAAGRPALRPGDHNLRLLPDYRDDRPIHWVEGHDLLGDEPVLVPHSAVSYGSHAGAPPCYELATTNGLASGNGIEEAICHALCEVIERDAATLAEIVGERLVGAPGRADGSTSDSQRLAGRYPRLHLGTVPPRARPLVARFEEAGLPLRLVSITSDLGVPSVLASTTGAVSSSSPGSGLGTHPDIEVAIVRAITECAQTWVDDGTVASGYSCADGAVKVPDLPSYPSPDVVADIRFMLDRLRAGGLPRVVVVDLSPPDIPVHVVRILVPGLESWASDRSLLGARATRAWNRAADRRGQDPATVVGHDTEPRAAHVDTLITYYDDATGNGSR